MSAERHALASIALLWLRSMPAAVLLVCAMVLGQVAGGIHNPAPSQLVTDPTPTDLTPSN